MSCIELKHSNLYRHFCKLGELAWGQKMPQNTSARSVGHARIFCVTRITKNHDWIAGKPLAPRSLFLNRQLLLCLLYFNCYWKKSSTMIFWGLSLFQAYQSCRALVRLWVTQARVRGEVALGWGIIHSQFLQVEIHRFTTKKELVALLQQQPANEEFVRSCRHHYIIWEHCIGCFGKLCKDFRDKL